MEKLTLEAHQAGRTAAAATFEAHAEEYQRHASVLIEAALE